MRREIAALLPEMVMRAESEMQTAKVVKAKLAERYAVVMQLR